MDSKKDAIDDVGSSDCSSLPCKHDWIAIEPYKIRCETCGKSESVPKGKPTPDHYFM